MAVELLSLSKFKLKLLSLIAEVRDIRERERGTQEELQLCFQRREEIEAEYTKKLQILQLQIASQEESQHMLESKIKYLETEKELLDKKDKELKETINCLLQSRENFQQHYEESTYQLKQSIQNRDRKFAILTEKLDTQIQLFDSIEKEAVEVKQVVNTIEDIVNGKEQEVTRLKRKVDQISTLENEFVEKILHLEKKHKNYEDELQRRHGRIIELEEKLEAEKISRTLQPQIEELQRTLMVKDEFIQRLTMEKQLLHLRLGKMEVMLRKLQEIALSINSQDLKLLTSIQESQEIHDMNSTYNHVDPSPPKLCGSPQGAANLDIPVVDSSKNSNVDNGSDASLIHQVDVKNSITDEEG
ncbi:cingulin-like protein 1 isoform X2 [Canna indica]|uniref:Cingulin-like protein 1 isoform X2 n=1 Tax=Canna indica TaxID=4628 RepID=A0AAQ3KDY6_9LILI|nr:cingulin-like protein 1 isoform X2 [Canna indica]